MLYHVIPYCTSGGGSASSSRCVCECCVLGGGAAAVLPRVKRKARTCVRFDSMMVMMMVLFAVVISPRVSVGFRKPSYRSRSAAWEPGLGILYDGRDKLHLIRVD